jgi:putative ABC transport system permease protein
MRFTTLIVKNLMRRPGRSLLTILGLAIGVGVVVSLVGLAGSFEKSFMKHYSERHIDLIVQRTGTSEDRLSRSLPEDFGPELAKLAGVKEVVGRLFDVIAFRNEGLNSVMIGGWPTDATSLFDRLKMLQGRRVLAGDESKAMIGRVLAANLGKQVGDEIELYSQPFEIVGIFESPTTFENGGVVVPLSELQKILNRPGEVSGYSIAAVQPIDSKGLEDLRRRVEALAPGIEATPMADFIGNIRQIRIGHAVAWLVSTIAVFIGGIGMLNTMLMSVSERTREFGILRAIGWRRNRIVRMVLGESLVLSFVGAVLGCVFGAIIAKGLTLAPDVSEWIEGNVTPSVIFQGFVVALAVGWIGGFFPALQGARMLPTEALRR